MSKYAVYKLFGSSSAPGSLVSCGYMAGSLVGTCDDNPLYRRPNTPDKFSADNEFSPNININVRPQTEED